MCQLPGDYEHETWCYYVVRQGRYSHVSLSFNMELRFFLNLLRFKHLNDYRRPLK